MKVQKIKLSSCDVTWIVLDDNHLSIKPITKFFCYLNNLDRSPCTVKSYTYSWSAWSLFCKSPSNLDCLSSFYRFHNQLGNTDVKVTESVSLPNKRYKELLHHVYKNKPSQRRIVSVKQIKQPPKTTTKDQFTQLRLVI